MKGEGDRTTAKTDKIDLFKQHKDEYAAPKEPALVTVKRSSYLTITGKGEPGGDVFQARAGALYAVAFTIKMTYKFAAGQDYKVAPLEGIYWGKTKADGFTSLPKSQWNWTLMIRTPEFIKQKQLKDALAALKEKGKGPEVAEVKLETLAEGKCVQMLHVGPYDAERETVERMLAFASDKGLKPAGPHHEIYLSDPRRVPPERLRTILRQPVA